LQRGFDLPTQSRKPGSFPLVSSSGVIDSHDEGPVSAPGVVTGRSGSIGSVFFVDEPFWPLNTTLYVRDFHGNDPRFVYHLLNHFDLKSYAGGTGVPTLNRNDVHSVSVQVPGATDEQRRIVAILDEAFEGIATAKANAEKNLQNARELIETFLRTAFETKGDDVQLSVCATAISDGDHAPPPKSPSGVPFITISNIDKETRRIDFGATFSVAREYFDALKPHRRPKRGDVLYTVTGSFGIPVLVEDDREFCFQRHIGLIRPKAEIDSRWLMYALLSPQARAQAEAGATGTAQRTVSLSVLRAMTVPKVGVEEQCRIAARLDALAEEIGRLKDIVRTKLAALDELKKSLLHQAFSGQL
jgi:type I restriction enzyme S subunit